jgi:hypothetical protein
MGFYPKIRTGNWGRLSQRTMFGNPILVDFDNRLYLAIELARFDKVRASAQLPRALFVPLFGRD